MQGSKVRKHVVLAHKWLYDFTTRPDMRITAERMLRDIRIADGLRECAARSNPGISMYREIL